MKTIESRSGVVGVDTQDSNNSRSAEIHPACDWGLLITESFEIANKSVKASYSASLEFLMLSSLRLSRDSGNWRQKQDGSPGFGFTG